MVAAPHSRLVTWSPEAHSLPNALGPAQESNSNASAAPVQRPRFRGRRHSTTNGGFQKQLRCFDTEMLPRISARRSYTVKRLWPQRIPGGTSLMTVGDLHPDATKPTQNDQNLQRQVRGRIDYGSECAACRRRCVAATAHLVDKLHRNRCAPRRTRWHNLGEAAQMNLQTGTRRAVCKHTCTGNTRRATQHAPVLPMQDTTWTPAQY